jgi:glycosyltransferase involved in cell wall biosynthesis
MHPTVAIIIPALNEAQHIGNCLESLARLAGGVEVVDVIVVDNGSTDQTTTLALQSGARVLSNPGASIGALRNLGARSTRADVLAFLDADCTVAPDWLRNAIRCMEETDAGIVGSTHAFPENASWTARAASLASADKVGEVNYIPSGNMFARRAAFEAVDGFNEALQTNEDVDLCRRVSRQGYLVRADPSIKAVHHGIPRSVAEFVRREIWHGLGSFSLFFDGLRQVTNVRVVPYAVFFAVMILGALTGLLLLVLAGDRTALIAVGAVFIATTIWLIFGYVGVRRPGWPLVVSWMLLYGIARGLSFLIYVATNWLPHNSRWRGHRRGRAVDPARR